MPNFSRFAPSTQDIDLWLFDVRQCTQAHFTAAHQFMSADEQQRAAKLLRGKDIFIASRWLLRKVLSGYTGVNPAALGFKRAPKGKPFLEGHGIEFSLSHSGHWALLAVGNNPLGVDIEAPQNNRDLLAIAQSFFHPLEYAHMKVLEETTQQEYFYQLWTLKEALLKAMGTGISAGLDKVRFSWHGGEVKAELAPDLQPISATPWQFLQLQKFPGLHLALAYQSPTRSAINWCNILDLSPA